MYQSHRWTVTVAGAALCLLAATFPVQAQDAPRGPESYKIDYQIREEGGKSRRYSMLLDSSGNGAFRVGTKVPYATSLAPNGVGTSFNYMDTGVNITTRLRPGPSGKLSLHSEIELSASQSPDKTPNPVVSNIKAVVSSFLTPKKPTVIASIEDPTTTRKFDVEVTVTPVE